MNEDIITGVKGLSLEKWAKKNRVDPIFAGSMAEAIDDPDETPYLLKSMSDNFSKVKKTAKEEVRESLVRIQIYCSIHGNSDPIKLSKQLFVAQTIERLLFGSNILLTEGTEEEEEEKYTRKSKK